MPTLCKIIELGIGSDAITLGASRPGVISCIPTSASFNDVAPCILHIPTTNLYIALSRMKKTVEPLQHKAKLKNVLTMRAEHLKSGV